MIARTRRAITTRKTTTTTTKRTAAITTTTTTTTQQKQHTMTRLIELWYNIYIYLYIYICTYICNHYACEALEYADYTEELTSERDTGQARTRCISIGRWGSRTE